MKKHDDKKKLVEEARAAYDAACIRRAKIRNMNSAKYHKADLACVKAWKRLKKLFIFY